MYLQLKGKATESDKRLLDDFIVEESLSPGLCTFRKGFVSRFTKYGVCDSPSSSSSSPSASTMESFAETWRALSMDELFALSRKHEEVKNA